MERRDYDAHIPNRIAPPKIPIHESRRGEHDPSRSGRPTFGKQNSSRSSYYAEPPIERVSSSKYPPNVYPIETYNGPVLRNESTRKSGFDQADVAMTSSRRIPLLKTPVIAVEHMGGDMDISRSRSNSPLERRNSRDSRPTRRDRRHAREDRSRSRRSRSHSSSRSRGTARHDERHRDRERESPKTPSGPVRDGIIYTGDNYNDFLQKWIRLINDEIRNSADRDVQGKRRIREILTNASEAEKEKLVMPPDSVRGDRKRMVHCDTTIDGLPAAIFFGSGYGSRDHYAKNAAAKDLVDKCNRVGVINSELHAAIAYKPVLDGSFHQTFAVQITKAVNAVLLLIRKMSFELLPSGFMTLRHLDPEIIDRFKHLLRMVMLDVYYQGVETPAAVVPKALETGHSSRKHEYPGSLYTENNERGPSRSSEPRELIRSHAEELAAMKKAMEEKMMEELALREQEIRRKVLEEERANIRAELERAQKIEQMMHDQQKYELQKAKEKQEFEENQTKLLMSKQVAMEFNNLVAELEKKFLEVRTKRLDHVLDMIYSSSTYKAIQKFNQTTSTYEQNQKMLVDLKQLIESIELSTQAAEKHNAGRQKQIALSGFPSSYYQMSGHSEVTVPLGYQASPATSSGYQLPTTASRTYSGYPVLSTSPGHLQTSTTSSHAAPVSSARQDEVQRLKVGDVYLRALTSSEKRRLAQGDKVITQDVNTGNWNLAFVNKVHDNIVTVTIGNQTIKKYMDEIYQEDTGSRY